MKKFGLLSLIILIATLSINAQGFVIITQYYEGLSNDKWLELSNVGNASLDLTSPQLFLHLFSNASADDPANSLPNNTYTLTGTLSVGQVVLFKNSSAVNPIYAAGTAITVCNFNGDDLVIISTSGNTTDVGVAWANRKDVCGDGSTWGENKSFVRNTSSINPSMTFNISNWTEFTNVQVDAGSTGSNERLGEYSGFVPLPVELSSFSATTIGSTVKLNWATATEVNNYGFEVERASLSASPLRVWEKIGFVNGNGNSNSPKSYSFEDKNVTAGKYSYRLKQIDNDGQFEYSKTIEVDFGTPGKFELAQNFPNPFNPETAIRFTLPVASSVKLTVFNLLGQEVKLLVNEYKEAGTHIINFNASDFNSGVYIYRLETNGVTQTRKMNLVK